MATTTRLGLTLISEATEQKATILNAGLNSIDAAIAGLSLTNAFSGANSFSNTTTFTGATKHSGAVGGNGTGFPFASATVTFPSNAQYTLTTSEYEAVFITINATNITSPQNMIFPGTAGGFWIVTNNSTQAITCKTLAGTGIAVAASRRAILTCGGVNVTRVTQDSVTTP